MSDFCILSDFRVYFENGDGTSLIHSTEIAARLSMNSSFVWYYGET